MTCFAWYKDSSDIIFFKDKQIFVPILVFNRAIQFTGRVSGDTPIKLFIDSTYFDQPYGDESLGERLIDAQTWSSTQYRGVTMVGDTTVFGVNFIDGRIKGYPKYQPGSNNNIGMTMYFRMVRGNPNYGQNNFVDNGDGTITDRATGLMWQKADDGIARDWENSISYAENLTLANFTDWRLPNAKELQSIVDYTRCPSVTQSAAIDAMFSTTEITDPDGNGGHYPYFWTSTSHLESGNPYSQGVYIAFGEALGKMNNNLMDVHGAGAQRSDPKAGNINDYPQYFGPQGDVRMVYNHVRAVRDVSLTSGINGNLDLKQFNIYPNPVVDECTIAFGSIQMEIDIEIYNILGTKVNALKMNKVETIQLNLSDLSSGIYLIMVRYDNGLVVRKITKK